MIARGGDGRPVAMATGSRDLRAVEEGGDGVQLLSPDGSGPQEQGGGATATHTPRPGEWQALLSAQPGVIRWNQNGEAGSLVEAAVLALGDGGEGPVARGDRGQVEIMVQKLPHLYPATNEHTHTHTHTLTFPQQQHTLTLSLVCTRTCTCMSMWVWSALSSTE